MFLFKFAQCLKGSFRWAKFDGLHYFGGYLGSLLHFDALEAPSIETTWSLLSNATLMTDVGFPLSLQMNRLSNELKLTFKDSFTQKALKIDCDVVTTLKFEKS